MPLDATNMIPNDWIYYHSSISLGYASTTWCVLEQISCGRCTIATRSHRIFRWSWLWNVAKRRLVIPPRMLIAWQSPTHIVWNHTSSYIPSLFCMKPFFDCCINLNHPNENEPIRCSVGRHALSWMIDDCNCCVHPSSILFLIQSHKNTIQMWLETEEATQQGHRRCTTFKYLPPSVVDGISRVEASCIIFTRQS